VSLVLEGEVVEEHDLDAAGPLADHRLLQVLDVRLVRRVPGQRQRLLNAFWGGRGRSGLVSGEHIGTGTADKVGWCLTGWPV
jgi:hypothetical protein